LFSAAAHACSLAYLDVSPTSGPFVGLFVGGHGARRRKRGSRRVAASRRDEDQHHEEAATRFCESARRREPGADERDLMII